MRASLPRPATLALIVVATVSVARLVALFVTPLELYPDEAQYWLWSRKLDWGYYSKPPMVAWLIALTTAIGGDGEPWVRFSALWLHAGAALALFAAGRRLYDDWTGFWAATLYTLIPGVQLSAGVIATDAPLLFCLALATWAYAALVERPLLLTAGLLGAALGAAALSKYAALYFVAGLALHAAFSREARAAWSPSRLAAAASALLAVLAPNLIWNALNGFETVAHTAANANWEAKERFRLASLAEFLGEQFGVFGPLPFAVLLVGVGVLAARRRLSGADLLLVCLLAPPLLVVSGQAFVSRANANWAAAAYPPAVVLVAALMQRWRPRLLLGGTVAIQGALAAVFLACVISPALADTIGLANGFKRSRGWRDTTAAVLARAAREPGLTAIAVDDRFLFNAMAYYGRDALARPGAPPLRMWVREAVPQNQAEATAPLTGANGRRVLGASLVERFRPEFQADFVAASPANAAEVRLDRKRTRRIELFIGSDFRPLPRDPRTGLPPPIGRATQRQP